MPHVEGHVIKEDEIDSPTDEDSLLSGFRQMKRRYEDPVGTYASSATADTFEQLERSWFQESISDPFELSFQRAKLTMDISFNIGKARAAPAAILTSAINPYTGTPLIQSGRQISERLTMAEEAAKEMTAESIKNMRQRTIDYEQWITDNPQYRPKPEWEGSFLDAVGRDKSLLYDPSFWIYKTASNGAAFISTVGTTAFVAFLTGNYLAAIAAGGLVIFPQNVGDFYLELVEAGLDEEQAMSVAILGGMVTTPLDMVGEMPMLWAARGTIIKPIKRELSNAAFRNIIKNISRRRIAAEVPLVTLAEMVTEGFTEVAQGEFTEIVKAAVLSDYDYQLDFSRIADAFAEGAAAVALPGAIIGGGGRIQAGAVKRAEFQQFQDLESRKQLELEHESDALKLELPEPTVTPALVRSGEPMEGTLYRRTGEDTYAMNLPDQAPKALSSKDMSRLYDNLSEQDYLFGRNAPSIEIANVKLTNPFVVSEDFSMAKTAAKSKTAAGNLYTQLAKLGYDGFVVIKEEGYAEVKPFRKAKLTTRRTLTPEEAGGVTSGRALAEIGPTETVKGIIADEIKRAEQAPRSFPNYLFDLVTTNRKYDASQLTSNEGLIPKTVVKPEVITEGTIRPFRLAPQPVPVRKVDTQAVERMRQRGYSLPGIQMYLRRRALHEEGRNRFKLTPAEILKFEGIELGTRKAGISIATAVNRIAAGKRPFTGMPSDWVQHPQDILTEEEGRAELRIEFDAVEESLMDIAASMYYRMTTPQEVGEISRFEAMARAMETAVDDNGQVIVNREFIDGADSMQDISWLGARVFDDPTRLIQSGDRGFIAGTAQKHILQPIRRLVLAGDAFMRTEKYAYHGIVERNRMGGRANKTLRKKYAYEVIQLIDSDMANASADTVLLNAEIQTIIGKLPKATQRRVVTFSQETRKFLDDIITKQNQVRSIYKRAAIEFRKNYLPWVVSTNTWIRIKNQLPDHSKMEDVLKPEYDHFVYSSTFNPRAEARKSLLGEKYVLERDPVKLLNEYIETARMDIFSTSILKLAKAHTSIIKDMGYENFAHGIEKWVAEGFGGIKPMISRAARAIVPKRGLQTAFFLRRLLTRSVFPLNWSWNLFIQTSSIGLTIMRYGLIDTIKGMDYMFDSKIRAEVDANGYSIIIKSMYGGKVVHQDLGFQMSKIKEIEGTVLDTAEQYLNFITTTFEKELTGISIRAAYRHGQKLGLESRQLWEYASDGGAKTQSMYNKEDQPGLLRAREVGVIAPFQTFAFEIFNTVREISPINIPIVGRTGIYETVAADSAIGRATIDNRVKLLLRWIAVMAITNMIADEAISRKPWTLSSFIPFWGLISGALGSGSIYSDPLPQRYIAEFWSGVKDLVKYNNFEPLASWASMLIPAGVQIERTVKSVIAISSGKVTDVRGEQLFEIHEDDYWNTLIRGIYHSKEGEEYIDKIKKTKGKFFEYTHIPGWNRADVAGTVKEAHRALGTSDEEGNIYTTRHFKTALETLRNKAGIRRLTNEGSPLVKYYLAMKERWENEYYALPAGVLRSEYLKRNPDVHAALLFWGVMTSTSRSSVARQMLDELAYRYNVPRSAIPALYNESIR